MRVLAALRCGRATISLGTSDSLKISACCTQLDITQVVEHWQLLEQRQIDRPWQEREVREFYLPELIRARGVRLVVNGSVGGRGVRLYEFTLLPETK